LSDFIICPPGFNGSESKFVKNQMFRQVLDFFVFGFVDPDPKEL